MRYMLEKAVYLYRVGVFLPHHPGFNAACVLKEPGVSQVALYKVHDLRVVRAPEGVALEAGYLRAHAGPARAGHPRVEVRELGDPLERVLGLGEVYPVVRAYGLLRDVQETADHGAEPEVCVELRLAHGRVQHRDGDGADEEVKARPHLADLVLYRFHDAFHDGRLLKLPACPYLRARLHAPLVEPVQEPSYAA